jgi:hypothetical protein
MKSQYQMLTCPRKSLATLLRELDWAEGRIFPGLAFGFDCAGFCAHPADRWAHLRTARV